MHLQAMLLPLCGPLAAAIPPLPLAGPLLSLLSAAKLLLPLPL
jgi:hypothetical protein